MTDRNKCNGDCVAHLTTLYKILKALLSNQPKGPKEIAIEIVRNPGTVRNRLVFMLDENLIQRVDYGKYTITELGREEYDRITQSLKDQSSGGTR